MSCAEPTSHGLLRVADCRTAGDLDLASLEPEERGEHMREALMATLDRHPDTDEAAGMVETLSAALEAHQVETGAWLNKRGPAALGKLKAAIAGFLGDLLTAPGSGSSGGLTYHSMQTNSFSEEPISAGSFHTVRRYLQEAGLLEHFPGFRPKPIDFGEGVRVIVAETRAARFRATPALIGMAEAHGVFMDCAEDHFPQPPVSKGDPLVILKSASRKGEGKKARGEPMAVTEVPPQIVNDLETIRDCLAGVTIEGGKHRHFKRQFEEGDREGFAWDRGGRLYSVGCDNYQQLKPAKRLAMRLNGEAVAEIDIRASHLMILHGRTQTPIDLSRDPYDIPGMDRAVVKTWVVASITNAAPLTRWSLKHKEDFAKGHPGVNLTATHPPRLIAATMSARLPLLGRLETLGMGWAKLQYIESEVIIATVLDLIREGVPSLPVHDSILVPVSQVAVAERLLGMHFEERVGIPPGLEVRTL